MELKEIYEELADIHADIRKSNNFTITATRRIQSVLFNLEIISEHIAEGKVIDPITHEVQLIRDELNKNTENLVNSRRRRLVHLMEELRIKSGIK